MKVQYAEKDTLSQLSQAINEYLASGWVLRGETVYRKGANIRFYQQIVYDEKNDEKPKFDSQIKE